MLGIKNIETLINVEDLLYNLLEEKDLDKETSKEWELFTEYWNLVEQVCQWKDSFLKDLREEVKEND